MKPLELIAGAVSWVCVVGFCASAQGDTSAHVEVHSADSTLLSARSFPSATALPRFFSHDATGRLSQPA